MIKYKDIKIYHMYVYEKKKIYVIFTNVDAVQFEYFMFNSTGETTSKWNRKRSSPKKNWGSKYYIWSELEENAYYANKHKLFRSIFEKGILL